MSPKKRIIIAGCLAIFLVVFGEIFVLAYGYDFVFPAPRRSIISGFTYADPRDPTHLAYDYRFGMHTKVAAAQSGWVATSFWGYLDGNNNPCDGQLPSRGNYIVFNHTSDDGTEGTGLETWFFHLSNTGNTPLPGTTFAIGQYMAFSGDTGCGTAHLHFATKLNGTPFDPYAGATNWVSAQPIPMGFRDEIGMPQGLWFSQE